MELFELFKDAVFMSGLLYLAAEATHPRLRCNGWQGAAQAGVVWTLTYHCMIKVAIALLIVPMALLAAIPVLGWLAVLGISFGVTCALAGVALWLAGLVGEDFRVDSPETAAWTGAALATARWMFDLLIF